MWNPIETAPKDGTLVLVIFNDGNITLAKNLGNATDEHNDWWDMDNLDFGYGNYDPIGWLPREALPATPTTHDQLRV